MSNKKASSPKAPVITVNRSAVNGQFVTKQFAKSHPKTTETEHRRK